MKRLIPFLVLVAAGCGSTGTDSTGTGDDDDTSGGFTCGSFTAGAGIICDSSTVPPTIRVDFGPNAGQAVEGDDPRLAAINPDKGKYIASFTPAAGTEAIGGMIIKNPATEKIGIRAADELCKAKNPTYTTAHMCTNDEILWNVRMGFIAAGGNGIAIGVHQDPGLGGVRSSFKGNCGGLTYNSADLQYTGSRWDAVPSDPYDQANGADDNVDALVVNFEGGLPCNTAGLPIACCQ